ncbi:MAG: metallophosphoesterase family protein, partial [bacterium]
MTILVFSDSHAALRFMRRYIEKFRPQAVIHLGDYYGDAESLQEDYNNIQFHIVPGNCDRNRCPINARELLCYPVGGVRLFMTHGHNHHVKSGIGALLADARR